MSGIKFHIGLVTDTFKRGLEQVKQSVESTAGVMNSKFARIAGLTAILYSFKRLANNLNEINDQAIRLGVTTDTIQKLDYAAKVSGTSMGSLEGAIRRLTKNLYMLQAGGQGADRIRKSFELLGLSAEDLKNTNINDLLPRIGEQLNKIADPKLKQGLIQDLAGRGGGRLIAFFERYKDLSAELENRGGIIPESAISAADDLDDSFTSILTTIKAIAAESGVFETIAKNVKDVLQGFDALRHPDKLPEGVQTRTEYKDKSFGEIFDSGFDVWDGLHRQGEAFRKNLEDRMKSSDLLTNFGSFPMALAQTLFGKSTVAEEVPFTAPLTKQDIDTSKKKRALEKAEQLKMQQALGNLGSDTDKDAEKNRKKKASLDKELALLEMRVRLNDKDYEVAQIIIETNKRIADAKTEELKQAERKIGQAKLEALDKQREKEEKQTLEEIKSGTTLAKMYNKVLKKQMSDKEYEIYSIRMKEAQDLNKADKEGASQDIMNAIKEKALADIANIIDREESKQMTYGHLYQQADVDWMNKGSTSNEKTLQEKSLEYQKETAEGIKEMNRKQTNKATYG